MGPRDKPEDDTDCLVSMVVHPDALLLALTLPASSCNAPPNYLRFTCSVAGFDGGLLVALAATNFPARTSRLPLVAAAAALLRAAVTLSTSTVRCLLIGRPTTPPVRIRLRDYPRRTTHPQVACKVHSGIQHLTQIASES